MVRKPLKQVSSTDKQITSLVMKQRSELATLPIGSVKPNPKNVRTHGKKQVHKIGKNITAVGYYNRIVVNRDYQVIIGHGRLEALKLLGVPEVDVIILPDITKEQEMLLMIADNKSYEDGGWDEEALAKALNDALKFNPDLDLELSCLDWPEIDKLIDNLDPQPVKQKDPADIIPALATIALTKPGDLWLLEKNRLLCGSCTEPKSYVILMAGKLAVMIFIDPPYNVQVSKISGLGKHKHREFVEGSGEKTPEQFTQFLETTISYLIEYSEDGSIHFVCMDWKHMQELLSAGRKYTELKNLVVWNKGVGGMGTFYRSQHELIFVFKNGSAKHINNFELGQHGRYRTNVWDVPGLNSFARNTKEGDLLALHPTVKPVVLVADAIRDCSRRNDIVLDCFIGSGSTIIAAERTGRICYGMELDPLYVDQAVRRWQRFTGKKAIHASTGLTFDEIEAQVHAEVEND